MPNKEMQDILTYSAMYCNNWEHAELLLRNTSYTRSDWFQKRKELINSPDDSTAPEWANYKAQDSTGNGTGMKNARNHMKLLTNLVNSVNLLDLLALAVMLNMLDPVKCLLDIHGEHR